MTTKFNNSITRGFAEVGEANVAVCILPLRLSNRTQSRASSS